jgi:hypothetical protein
MNWKTHPLLRPEGAARLALALDHVTTNDNVIHTGPLTALSLEPGAAYNPTTGAFINHFAGGSYDDIGLTFLRLISARPFC